VITWDSIDVVIPAVVSIPERLQSLTTLLADLAIQCPGVVVHTIPQWTTDKYTERDAFVAISNVLAGATRRWVIYMEEDVELDPEFGARVPQILTELPSTHPFGAVSFFSSDEQDKERLAKGVYIYEREEFFHSQCIAMRLHVAQAWQRMIVPWWDAAPQRKKRCIDLSFGSCCKEIGTNLLTYLPSLVQHRQIPSGYGHTICPRSNTFGAGNGDHI